MKSAIVVGGSNGLGMAISLEMLKQNYEKIIVFDREKPCIEDNRIEYEYIDLTNCDFAIFDNYKFVDALIITAGFGRAALFETITHKEIENSFLVNSVATISIIKSFYDILASDRDFKCAVVGSIAGFVSSPFFALYSATKAAICRFAESVNIELEKKGVENRILNVSPGSIKGTRFNGEQNDISLISDLAKAIINEMNLGNTLFIPQYDEIYRNVVLRYRNDAHKFGLESYDYKLNSNRLNNKPQVKVGYLSGTFDLFHIGHLNLLKKAKRYCDYLVVGVHRDASHKNKEVFIPFEERVEILKAIGVVDKVIESKPEDSDVYADIKYDYLFVGSDYKGTERFNRYEEFFKDKGVKIIYFPYTKGTSSTQLRNCISPKQEG